MTFNPDATLQDWIKAGATTEERIKVVRDIVTNSKYDGPYKALFTNLSVSLYDVFVVVKKETADGFQFRDLEPILATAGPALYEIYGKIVAWGKEGEREAIFRDLVIFIYYEVEKFLKMNGFFKFILRTAVRMWVAKKLAKYLLMGFDYFQDKVESIKGKAESFVLNLVANL